MKREPHLFPRGNVPGWKIPDVNTEPGIARRNVAQALPGVDGVTGWAWLARTDDASLFRVELSRASWGSLADEKRPGPTYADSVKKAAVFVLAVPVAVLTAPRGTGPEPRPSRARR
jgi:hypothetical protein